MVTVFEKGPYLQAAMICERVLQETNGVISVIRVIDRVTHTVVDPEAPEKMEPFNYALTLVVALKSGPSRGTYQVRIDIESSPLRYDPTFSRKPASLMSSIGWPTPPLKVPRTELRQAFNDGGYLASIQDGSLRTVLWSHGHATSQSGEPPCTSSQMVLYVTPQGNPVALVHQYRRQDGSLGASGLPDPKVLVTNDGRVLAS